MANYASQSWCKRQFLLLGPRVQTAQLSELQVCVTVRYMNKAIIDHYLTPVWSERPCINWAASFYKFSAHFF